MTCRSQSFKGRHQRGAETLTSKRFAIPSAKKRTDTPAFPGCALLCTEDNRDATAIPAFEARSVRENLIFLLLRSLYKKARTLSPGMARRVARYLTATTVQTLASTGSKAETGPFGSVSIEREPSQQRESEHIGESMRDEERIEVAIAPLHEKAIIERSDHEPDQKSRQEALIGVKGNSQNQ